jgi:hypothetical protein
VALRDATGLWQWLWWIMLYGWNVGLGLWLLRTTKSPFPDELADCSSSSSRSDPAGRHAKADGASVS